MTTRTRRLAPLFFAAVALLLATPACNVEIGGFGVSVGPDAPNYTITMYQGGGAVGGETVEFDRLKEMAPLIVYYFHGRCEQCRGELELLEAVAAQHKVELTVLAVDMGPVTGAATREEAEALLAGAGATFPAGSTSDESVEADQGVEAIPTTAFYREEGHYRLKLSGVLLEADLREGVEDLLE